MRIGPEMHKASRTRSVSGVRWLGVPYISYAATKAAVIQFTRVIALQYVRSGIRANSILRE